MSRDSTTDIDILLVYVYSFDFFLWGFGNFQPIEEKSVKWLDAIYKIEMWNGLSCLYQSWNVP